MTFELALRYGIQRMKQKGYNRYQWQPTTVLLGPKQNKTVQVFNEYCYFYYPCPCNQLHALTDQEYQALLAEDYLRIINEAQKTYHLANSTFAPDLITLGLPLSDDTLLGYSFSVSLINPDFVLALATPTMPNLPAATEGYAFLAGSYYKEKARAIDTNGPNPIPSFSGGVFSWPDGSALLPYTLLRAEPINTMPLGNVRIDSDHNTVVLNRLGMDNIEFTGNLTFTNHTLKTQELFFLRFTPLCKQHGYARADHD